MINTLTELLLAFGVLMPPDDEPSMRVRVLRNNGDHVMSYLIENVEFDEGIMEIWLNEKGDQEQ